MVPNALGILVGIQKGSNSIHSVGARHDQRNKCHQTDRCQGRYVDPARPCCQKQSHRNHFNQDRRAKIFQGDDAAENAHKSERQGKSPFEGADPRSLTDRVPRNNDRDAPFGNLTWLQTDWSEADPTPGAIDLTSNPGHVNQCQADEDGRCNPRHRGRPPPGTRGAQAIHWRHGTQNQGDEGTHRKPGVLAEKDPVRGGWLPPR